MSDCWAASARLTDAQSFSWQNWRNIHVYFPGINIDFPCLRIFKWGARLLVLLFIYLWKFSLCVSKSFRTLWKCKNGLPHR